MKWESKIFMYRVFVILIITLVVSSCGKDENKLWIPPDPVLLSEDGSWCWFQDERAIIDGDQLLFTGVTKEGVNTVTVYNLQTEELETVIHNDETFPPDDHNVGVLMVRPDGRYLSMYAGHNDEKLVRYRISKEPGNALAWGPEQIMEVHEVTTYSNVYRLSDNGRTYNFWRGRGDGWNPHYMFSDDDGETWEYGGRLIYFEEGPPYPRYTSNGKDKIHLITTQSHPSWHYNDIYHAYIKNEIFHASDGTPIGPLSRETVSDITPGHFTRVFESKGDDTAWTCDIQLDKDGHPYIVFSVTKDPEMRGSETGSGGFDHRYHYARWDGEQWYENEIAYAGSRLYPNESEYSGLISLHPFDPNVVYMSADVNPVTGEALMTEGEQRYEIFRGVTTDRGATWKWAAVTENSKQDNIRPVVASDGNRTAVLWLKGRYTTYEDYHLQVWGIIDP